MLGLTSGELTLVALLVNLACVAMPQRLKDFLLGDFGLGQHSLNLVFELGEELKPFALECVLAALDLKANSQAIRALAVGFLDVLGRLRGLLAPEDSASSPGR